MSDRDKREATGGAIVVIVILTVLIAGAFIAWGESPPEGVRKSISAGKQRAEMAKRPPETAAAVAAVVERTPRFRASIRSTGQSRVRVVGTVPVPVDRGRVEIDLTGDGEWEVRARLDSGRLRLRIDDCTVWHSSANEMWTVECGGSDG